MLRIPFYILTFVFTCASAYMSFQGFLRSFQELAYVAAFGILVFLIAGNHRIRVAREDGQSPAGGIALLLFAGVFSFSSNFNFVYTNEMQAQVAASTLREANEVFRGNLIRAEHALRNTEAMRRAELLQQDFNRELGQLRAQITDRANPGVGPEARQHMEQINKLIGAPVTDLDAPPRGARHNDPRLVQWYESYSAAARIAFEARRRALGTGPTEDLLGEINAALAEHAAVPASPSIDDLAILRTLAAISAEIEQRARLLLDPDAKLRIAAIDSDAGQLGEIRYSLVNGFVEMPKPAATVYSTVVALLVDILPPVFALLAFRRKRRRVNGPPGWGPGSLHQRSDGDELPGLGNSSHGDLSPLPKPRRAR